MAVPVQGLQVPTCIVTVCCSDFIGYSLLPSCVVPSLAKYKNLAKCFEDLTIRPDGVKLLEENIGGKAFDMGFGSDFLDMIPKEQATKGKIDKWNCIKIKSLCTAKKIIEFLR